MSKKKVNGYASIQYHPLNCNSCLLLKQTDIVANCKPFFYVSDIKKLLQQNSVNRVYNGIRGI